MSGLEALHALSLCVAGAFGVVLANSDLLVPREVRLERLERTTWDTRLPRASASVGFAERSFRRARWGVWVSLVLAVLLVVGLFLSPLPQVAGTQLAVLLVAAAGSMATRAVLAGQEAFVAARDGGQRVARGWTPTLRDYAWLWPAVLFTVAQVAYLGWMVPRVLALGPESAGWTWGCVVVSILVTIGGWGLATWLPAQPHLAFSRDDLKWNDWDRGQNIASLLFLGPALAVLLMLTLPVSVFEAPVDIRVPSWGYGALLVVTILLLQLGQRRRYLTRLWPEDAASENGGSAQKGGHGARR